MNKDIIRFGDTEIEKRKFYYFKYTNNINNVDIDKKIIAKHWKNAKTDQ